MDKVTETKGMNFQINDPIQKAYDKMLGVEDVIEQSQQEEQEIKESVKEINDLPDIAQLDEIKSITKSDVQKAVRGAKGKVPIGREYILNTDSNSSVAPMVNQMKSALTKSNVTDAKLGKGFEVKTKKGSVLIKPEVAELYIKSRDALPRPIQKNMDMIAEKDVDGLFQMLNDAMNDLLKGKIESYIEESKEVSDDIIISEDGKEFIIDEKKFTITQGVANAFRKPELAYGKIMVKKICSKCNFHMPAFTGRYPSNCPLCGTPFAQSEKVKYSLNTEGRCIAVLEELKEGKFKEISQEIDMTVDDIVQQIKDRKVKNNRDLNSLLKKMKSGKDLPSGVQTSTVKNNFSKIVTGISAKIKKDKVKF